METGEKIKGIRKAKKLTQGELSELTKNGFTKKIGESYISKIEKLHSKNPSKEILLRIARALDVTPEYLISEQDFYPQESFGYIAIKESFKRFLTEGNLSPPERELIEPIALRGEGPNTVEGWRKQLSWLKMISSPQQVLPFPSK